MFVVTRVLLINSVGMVLDVHWHFVVLVDCMDVVRYMNYKVGTVKKK